MILHWFEADIRAKLGLAEASRLRRIAAEHQPFLAWHRTKLFQAA